MIASTISTTSHSPVTGERAYLYVVVQKQGSRKEWVRYLSEIHHCSYLRSRSPTKLHISINIISYIILFTESRKAPYSNMEDISAQHLTTLFDQLVSEGVVIYGPHTKHIVEDEGYPVCYSLHAKTTTSLTVSPDRIPHLSIPNQKAPHSRRFQPLLQPHPQMGSRLRHVHSRQPPSSLPIKSDARSRLEPLLCRSSTAANDDVRFVPETA